MIDFTTIAVAILTKVMIVASLLKLGSRARRIDYRKSNITSTFLRPNVSYAYPIKIEVTVAASTEYT